MIGSAKSPPSAPAARIYRSLLRQFLEAAGVLPQLFPDFHGRDLLVDHDHPAPELITVLGLEGVFHVLGSNLDPAGAEFTQSDGRVDDVPGILHRADPTLLVQSAQPTLTVDSKPLGRVFDLLVDLGRRDLELLAAERLLDDHAVNQ